jgi:L-ribulose-5-phosphate 4-epimerase
MPLDRLKSAVLNANLATQDYGLVKSTFGNVSAIDRNESVIIIKPSGVDYGTMKADDMVVTNLSGDPLRTNMNRLNPSSDLATHVELYRAFPDIGAVVHTHSPFATVFAQMKREIKPLGTTHADYFRGPIPITRDLTDKEISGDYVRATGQVIIERFADLCPNEIPAVLVSGHGPFVWGTDCQDAVNNALMLEETAKLAWHVEAVSGENAPISQALLDRHFFRKHGKSATYGQDQYGSERA